MEQKKHSFPAVRVVLVISLFLLSFFSLRVGVKNFSMIEFIKGNENEVYLALISRFPRLISILITGAGLSIAGLIMQTITNNKFVSPSTAGTMEWCKLGILIAIFFAGGESKMAKMAIAFFISLAGTLFFMKVLQQIPYKNAIMVPLIGMMMGSVVNAISTFFAYKYDLAQNISSWMQGNFSLIIKGRYEILYLGIPVLVIAYLYAGRFTIAGMGESISTNLGLNHKAVVLTGLVLVAFITSIIVVAIGSIPFIGLIVPNIVGLYKGDNLKKTLLDTVLIGALFVLVCDLLGRVLIFPYELSISIVVSIIGSILFLIIIFRKRGSLG